MMHIKSQTWIFSMILVLAAVIRLLTLEHSAFRADTMEFFRYAAAERTPWELLKEQPWENQIPATEAYMLWVIQTFRLPVTGWTVRFPVAFLGILSVLFIYRMAQTFLRERLALLVAFLVAINPFSVTVSMEAYYYSGLICFSAMFYWRSMSLVNKLRDGLVRFRDWFWWLLSSVLMCSTQMIAWSVFGMVWLFLMVEIIRLRKRTNWKRVIFYFVGCSGLVLISIVPWVIKPIKLYLFSDAKPLGIEKLPWTNFLRILGETIPVYTFGISWWGIALLLCIVVAGVGASWRASGAGKAGRAFFLMGCFAAAGNVALCLVMGQGQGKYTYFSATFPLVMVGMAYLFDRIIHVLSLRWKSLGRYGLPAVALLCALYWAIPLHAVMLLEGKPTAYKEISEYINNNTPPGTPVLVDRWFEPWNELSLYPLEEGRQWTFTVPNEPAQTAWQMRWHESVIRFFEENPQAVYLPLMDSYRGDCQGAYQIGPWAFPEEHFAEHIQLRHEAGLTLSRWGLAVRDDFYLEGQQGRLVVNLYFNTREDLINKARAAGQSSLALYGSGWSYIKPWQRMPGWSEQLLQMVWIQAGLFAERGQTVNSVQDIQRLPQGDLQRFLNQGRWADYRVVTDQSTVRLYNLTDGDMNAELTLVGLALTGPIHAKLGGAVVLFPATLLSARKVSVVLKPGENDVSVFVPPGQILLVKQIGVQKRI